MIARIAELTKLSIPEGAVLSINFPGPRTMRRINKTHLQHDYLTDVICFNYTEGEEVIEDGDVAVEVFISPDIAKQRAEEDASLVYSSEMVLYLVHAILHATGMDDKNASQKQAMRQKEAEIITVLSEEFDFAEVFPE